MINRNKLDPFHPTKNISAARTTATTLPESADVGRSDCPQDFVKICVDELQVVQNRTCIDLVPGECEACQHSGRRNDNNAGRFRVEAHERSVGEPSPQRILRSGTVKVNRERLSAWGGWWPRAAPATAWPSSMFGLARPFGSDAQPAAPQLSAFKYQHLTGGTYPKKGRFLPRGLSRPVAHHHISCRSRWRRAMILGPTGREAKSKDDTVSRNGSSP